MNTEPQEPRDLLSELAATMRRDPFAYDFQAARPAAPVAQEPPAPNGHPADHVHVYERDYGQMLCRHCGATQPPAPGSAQEPAAIQCQSCGAQEQQGVVPGMRPGCPGSPGDPAARRLTKPRPGAGAQTGTTHDRPGIDGPHHTTTDLQDAHAHTGLRATPRPHRGPQGQHHRHHLAAEHLTVPRGLPVSPETRAQVLRLHGEGVGRNAIAAQVGISTATVTGITKAAGLDFTRKDTAVAVAARTADLRVQRADIARRLMVKAAELLDSMTGPYEVHAFGAGRDERYELRTGMVSRPPAGDQAKLMTALGIAVQRSLELDRADNDGGQAAAVSVVDGLMQAFRGAVALLPDPVAVTEP